MNILLICSYFGPETSMGVNRVNSFTRHWLGMECTIDVVTMPFNDELPSYLQGNNRLNIHQVTPFFMSPKKNLQSFNEVQSPSMIRIRKLIYWLRRHIFSNYLDPRVFWWPKAAIKANHICQEKKIDVVLSSVPSYTAHSIAAFVKKRNPSVLWVADYRDVWSGCPIFPGCMPVRAIQWRHERFILKHADIFLTINHNLENSLKKIHGERKYLIVPNGFEPTDHVTSTSLSKVKGKQITIVYTGTFFIDYYNPEPLFQALMDLILNQLIPETSINLIFYGDAKDIRNTETFQFLLEKNIIQLKGVTSRSVALKAQRDADLLLFLGATPLKSGQDVVGVVSGKIFEYLTSGTEILAVGVTENMIVGEMIKLSGMGELYYCGVQKIKDRILDLYKNGPKKLIPNTSYLDNFNRAKQASFLLSQIKNNINL